MKNDIFKLKELIENNVEQKYLDNPYLLYDMDSQDEGCVAVPDT